MAEMRLERAHRIDVLRRTRIVPRATRKQWKDAPSQRCKLLRLRQAAESRDFEPHDTRHRAVDHAPLREPEVPRVPFQPLVAELEDRRPLAPAEPRQDTRTVAIQVRA